MQTPSDSVDGYARVIGERVLFDIREDRLRNVVRPEYQIQLDRPQAQVLLQLVRMPQVMLNRKQVIEHLARRDGLHLTDHTLDEIVRALRDAFRRLDPDSVYIRTLPRLGYVLVSTVTAANIRSDQSRGRFDLR